MLDTHEVKVIREVAQQSMSDPPSLPCKAVLPYTYRSHNYRDQLLSFRKGIHVLGLRILWATLARKKTYTCIVS